MLLGRLQIGMRSVATGVQSLWQHPDGAMGFDPYEPVPVAHSEIRRVFTRKFGKTSYDQLSTAQQSNLMSMDTFREPRHSGHFD